MNIAPPFSRVALVSLLAVACAAPAMAGFKVIPVFDSGIEADPSATAIKACITSVIAHYETKFTDNITVKVYFQKGGGLGSSLWGYYYNGAGVAYNALDGDVTSLDDSVAVSHMRSSGYGSIAYTTANGRALGLNTPGFITVGGEGGFDGVVTLNTSICFFDHNSPVGGKFDLYSAAAHELDEVLGTPSGAGDWLAFTTDLYRYDNFGNRNFSGDTTAHVYFSIDGTNRIVEYNQFGRTGGDWGDWVSHSPSMTQDWAIFSGIKIDPGEPEFRLLDVIGYDRSQLNPESFTVLRGTLASGNLNSLFTVDADPMVLRPGVVPFNGDFPVQVVLQGTSRFANPGGLKFCVTSKVPIPNIGQTIELFDFGAGSFVVVDFRVATQTYSRAEVSVANPARFVEPVTKQVLAKIKYKGTQPLQLGAWTASLDQAVWEITP